MREFPHTKRNHRSGNWVYFRRFPLGAQASIKKKFFERSLKTRDHSKIASAWAAADAEFARLIDACITTTIPSEAKKRTFEIPSTKAYPSLYTNFVNWDKDISATFASLNLNVTEMRGAISRWGDQQRYDRAQALINEPSSKSDEAFSVECSDVGACGHKRNWLFHSPKLYELTRSILDESKITIPPLHGSFYIVERMVEEELKAVLESEHRWRCYDFASMPDRPPTNQDTKGIAPNGKPFMNLTELLEKYISVTRKPKKTASKLRMVFRYISDIVGNHATINEISKQTLIDLQGKALTIPARLNSRERAQSINDLSASAMHTSQSRPRLSPQAIGSWFNLLGGCFNWAIRADLLSHNPATGIKPVIRKTEIKPRRPFSQADIEAIFDQRYYHFDRNSSRFWLPLLALYTGARLNELGQLTIGDVLKNPYPALRISDLDEDNGAKKSVKNINARRIIPLHRSLLQMGFMDFVNLPNRKYVFSDLPHDGEYEPTKAFSQWFGRYIRSRGILDSSKVFHSFRHAFKDECRRVGIEEEVHDALTGHAASIRSIGRSYGLGVPEQVLYQAMQKIYPATFEDDFFRAIKNSC